MVLFFSILKQRNVRKLFCDESKNLNHIFWSSAKKKKRTRVSKTNRIIKIKKIRYRGDKKRVIRKRKGVLKKMETWNFCSVVAVL